MNIARAETATRTKKTGSVRDQTRKESGGRVGRGRFGERLIRGPLETWGAEEDCDEDGVVVLVDADRRLIRENL